MWLRAIAGGLCIASTLRPAAGEVVLGASLHSDQQRGEVLPLILDEEDEDEEFVVHDGPEAMDDGSLLACSFLEEEEGAGSGGTALAESSSQARLAQRFAMEICRTGNYHEIASAVGSSTVEMLLSKEGASAPLACFVPPSKGGKG